MINTSNDRPPNNDTSDRVNCEKYEWRIEELEQALNEKEDQISHLYQLYEDDLFRTKELEDVTCRIHNDTNEGDKQNGGEY